MVAYGCLPCWWLLCVLPGCHLGHPALHWAPGEALLNSGALTHDIHRRAPGWLSVAPHPLPRTKRSPYSRYFSLRPLSAVATFMNIEAFWWFSELSKRSHILRMKKISKRFAASKCFLNTFSSVSVDCACEATSKTILTLKVVESLPKICYEPSTVSSELCLNPHLVGVQIKSR